MFELRDDVTTELDDVMTELDDVMKELDDAMKELDDAMTERDDAMTERDDAMTERDDAMQPLQRVVLPRGCARGPLGARQRASRLGSLGSQAPLVEADGVGALPGGESVSRPNQLRAVLGDHHAEGHVSELAVAAQPVVALDQRLHGQGDHEPEPVVVHAEVHAERVSDRVELEGREVEADDIENRDDGEAEEHHHHADDVRASRFVGHPPENGDRVPPARRRALDVTRLDEEHAPDENADDKAERNQPENRALVDTLAVRHLHRFELNGHAVGAGESVDAEERRAEEDRVFGREVSRPVEVHEELVRPHEREFVGGWAELCSHPRYDNAEHDERGEVRDHDEDRKFAERDEP